MKTSEISTRHRLYAAVIVIALVCLSTRLTAQSWVVGAIDSVGNVGQYSSITMSQTGEIWLTYYDATNQKLKYARKSGSSWNTFDLLLGISTAGWSSIMIDDVGRPSVVLGNPVTAEVKYLGWLPLPPTASVSVIDASGSAGEYSSLATDGAGNLALTYRVSSTKLVRLAQKAGGDWTFQNLFTSTGTPSWSSLAYDQSNRPSVVLTDPVTAEVKYLGWLPLPPTASVSVIDASGSAGEYSSLATDGAGNLALTYRVSSTKLVRLAQKAGGDWTFQNLFTSTGTPSWSSLAYDQSNRPSVVLTDPVTAEVKYLGWLPLPPTASVSVIDASGSAGEYSSLATDGAGNLALTYRVSSTKLVRLAQKAGGDWTFQNLFTSTGTPTWSSLAYDQSNRPSVVLTDPVTAEVKYLGWLPLPPTASISVIDASVNPGVYSCLRQILQTILH